MTAPLPHLTAIPPDLISVHDYERYAAERLDDHARAFLFSGAGDELTLRRNTGAFDHILLNTRPLARVAGGHTRLELFGKPLAHPVIVAPAGYLRMLHPEGEAGLARAAEATDSLMVVSTMTSTSLAEIAAAAPGAPRWFQLYIRRDRDFTKSLVRHAEAAGCEAIVVTVDALFTGMRHRLRRIGFVRPPGVDAVLLRDEPPCPHRNPTHDESHVFDDVMADAPTWNDIRWLRTQTGLPLLVKGVTTPEGAVAALDYGADGIIVSNHGGRVLDTMPASIEMLPAIVERIGGAAPVLLDGGVRRGSDVLKALAFGASAVLVGRAPLFGLAAAGPLGAAHSLKLLREEFEAVMALTGCKTLADIGPRVIFKP